MSSSAAVRRHAVRALVPALIATLPIAGAAAQAATTTDRALAALGAPLAPPVPAAGSYRYELLDEDGDHDAGAVAWRDGMVRIDVAKGSFHFDLGSDGSRGQRRASARGSERQWLLVDQRRGLLHIVKDDERVIETMPVADFEDVVGRIMRKIGPVVKIAVADAGILAEDLGDGGLVAGVPTRRFRIVERYRQRVSAMGFSADAEQVTVTTEVRVPVRSGVPSNPVTTLVTGTASKGALFDAAHRAKVERARSALWRGTPLSVVIVSEERDADEPKATRKTVAMTTTAIDGATPDAARFVLPDGYQRKQVNFGRAF
jgi:hypothetical protein